MKNLNSNPRSPFLALLNAVPVCQRRIADTDWFPAADVSETEDEFLFEFDLPGMKRDEIQISLDGNVLHLSGARTTQQHNGNNLRVERPAGAFVRQLVLPASCCYDEIHTALENGVLELHLPKQKSQNRGSIIRLPSTR